MKIRILSILLVIAMLLGAFCLASCSDDKAEKGAVTRMTVDINPSIEFMIDDENKVVSVTALNDDGSILIAGEAFVGMTPEEATELVISLATETGYLVKGNAEVAENTVKISVSGDTKYAENLAKSVEKKAAQTLERLDINGKIEKIEAMNRDALLALAAETSLYSEEELNAMSDEELYKVIAAGRIETAMLLTEEMRAAYYAAKEHKISFAKSEATAKVIEAMGGMYTITHTIYKSAIEAYSGAISALDELRYDLLISPESEYQKSLAYLRESKTEFLKQRNYTATLDVNGTEYTLAVQALTISEENYDKALAAYESIGNKVNESLEALIATLRTSEEALRALEDKFSDDIKAELSAKAGEIEERINAAKDSFFADFEAAHSDDITAIENSLKAQKDALIAEIDAE